MQIGASKPWHVVCFVILIVVLLSVIDIYSDIGFIIDSNGGREELVSVDDNDNLNVFWDEINPDELERYFTEYELSSLMIDTAIQNGLNITNSSCNVEPQYCCICSVSKGGISVWNPGQNHCYARDYKLRFKIFDKQKAFNTHDIFWTLPNNSNIIVIGDSIQNQIFNGFECDIIRNNHYPFNHRTIKMIQNEGIDFNKLIPNWTNIEYEMNEINHDFRYQLKDSIHSTKNITLIGNQNGKKHIIHLLQIRQYRPFIPMYMNTFCEWANIYLFQWELHYSPISEQWKTDIGDGIFRILQKCFDKYISLNNKPIFIWNEAPAQHWGKFGGHYHDIYNDDNMTNEYKTIIAMNRNDSQLLLNDTKWKMFFDSRTRYLNHIQCEPHHYINPMWERNIRRIRIMDYINDNSKNLSFHVEIVDADKQLKYLKNNTLYFIPFKDYTNSLWNMHDNGDCTHYCVTPYLWQIIWHFMYQVIQHND